MPPRPPNPIRIPRLVRTIVGVSAGMLGGIGCQPVQSTLPEISRSLTTDSSASSLIVHPDPLALGTLAPGQSADATLKVRDPRAETVVVERIETSCPCVRVTPAGLSVGPGSTAELTVAFDPSEAPDFRGGLEVAVIGRDGNGHDLFRAEVNMTVRFTPVRPSSVASSAERIAAENGSSAIVP